MRRAHFLRAEHARRNAVAKPFEISQDFPETESDVSADVLKEHDAGFCSRDDSTNRRPKVARIPFAKALASGAEWLARVARRDRIHSFQSALAPAEEGLQIVPNRDAAALRVLHDLQERGRCTGFPLTTAHSNGSDSNGFAGELEADAEHSRSGCKVEIVVGGFSHI